MLNIYKFFVKRFLLAVILNPCSIVSVIYLYQGINSHLKLLLNMLP